MALSKNGFRPEKVLAVLFDLDGTLRFNRPSSNEVFLDCAAKLGVETSQEERMASNRWNHYYWAQSPELLQDLEAYNGEEDVFWTHFTRRNLMALSCDEETAQALAPDIHAYMKVHHLPEDWVPPETPATLQTLHQAGKRLAVLSNRRDPCDDQLETYGLLAYLEFALVAGQVSFWKPQPEIFSYALERLEISPSQALYVGDNYYADVVGARRAGLQPVLIDPDGVFPEADCPVISSLGELPALLQIAA